MTPCNIHNSAAFDAVFERLIEHSPEVQAVTTDAEYKTPGICKQIFDSGRVPSLPYGRPMTKKGNLPWYEYVCDEYRSFSISEIDPIAGTVTFTNGFVIRKGDMIGDVSEKDMRRIQIRETIFPTSKRTSRTSTWASRRCRCSSLTRWRNTVSTTRTAMKCSRV